MNFDWAEVWVYILYLSYRYIFTISLVDFSIFLVYLRQKTEKFEFILAARLSSNSNQPDPKLLTQILNSLANCETTSDILIGVLWNSIGLPANALQPCLKALETIGILLPTESSDENSNVEFPVTSAFSNLNADQWWQLVLRQDLPEKPPALNWRSTPLPDELQFTFRFEFQFVPPGFLLTLISTLSRLGSDEVKSYQYLWRDGLLMNFGEVCV